MAKKLEKFLRTIHFERSIADACLHFRKDSTITSLRFFHAEDLIICMNNRFAKEVIKSIRNEFEVHGMGYSAEIFGIQVKISAVRIHSSTAKSEIMVIPD